MPISNPPNVSTLTNPTINGLIAGTADIAAALAAAANNSTTSAQGLTGFSFAIGASETWEAVAELHCTGGSAGTGLKLTVTAPSLGSGAMRLVVFGETSAAGSFTNEVITTPGTLSTNVFVGGATISGCVRLTFGIQTIAGTPGTVQVAFASSSGGTSVSVNALSTFSARRTA